MIEMLEAAWGSSRSTPDGTLPMFNTMPDEPDRLLKAAELQVALAMSRAKVYRMMQDGTLPTVRVGGSVRVPRRALVKWIEENTQPGLRLAVAPHTY
jgi:excisionase family DNA binding protein